MLDARTSVLVIWLLQGCLTIFDHDIVFKQSQGYKIHLTKVSYIYIYIYLGEYFTPI
jgi:hypothetical protein